MGRTSTGRQVGGQWLKQKGGETCDEEEEELRDKDVQEEKDDKGSWDEAESST